MEKRNLEPARSRSGGRSDTKINTNIYIYIYIYTYIYIYIYIWVVHVILNPLNLVAVGRGAALLYKHVYYICIATPRYEIVLVQDYMCHMHKNIYKSHIH